MAKIITDSRFYSEIADAIRSKNDSNDAYFPSEMAGAISNLESTDVSTISDGIVVTARDADGYATEVEFYCSDGIIHAYDFGYSDLYSNNITTLWSKLEKLRLKSRITRIDNGAFHNCKALRTIVSDVDENPFEYVETFNDGSQFNYSFRNCGIECNLSFPRLTKTNGQVSCFEGAAITGLSCESITGIHQAFARNCKNLKTLYLPKCASVRGDSAYCFGNCTTLETVQLGSIGYPCGISYPYNPFGGCTQSNLTITLYCSGSDADNQLRYVRNGATNATIIIKAASDTSYNNVAYSAGDTIITSSV